MQRISNPPSNQFVDGNPSTATQGTIVSAAWLNAIQEELAYVIEQAGLVLSSGNQTQLKKALDKSIGIGSVAFFAQSAAPAGWIKANGAALSRTTYADLFAAIGTTFGAGDGSTTFNIPDLRGEFLRGLDDGRGTDSGRALGSWQAPTLVSAAIGPDFAQMLVVEGATANLASTAEFNVALQTDDITDGNYGSALKGFAYANTTVAYTGNSAARSVDGNADRPLNSNNYYKAGGTRPRNIALLCCIKY